MKKIIQSKQWNFKLDVPLLCFDLWHCIQLQCLWLWQIWHLIMLPVMTNSYVYMYMIIFLFDERKKYSPCKCLKSPWQLLIKHCAHFMTDKTQKYISNFKWTKAPYLNQHFQKSLRSQRENYKINIQFQKETFRITATCRQKYLQIFEGKQKKHALLELFLLHNEQIMNKTNEPWPLTATLILIVKFQPTTWLYFNNDIADTILMMLMGKMFQLMYELQIQLGSWGHPWRGHPLSQGDQW